MTDAPDLRTAIGLFTPTDVAAMLGLSPHTLAMWRWEKKGPAFVKLGRNVFYRLDDVKLWIDANQILPDEEPGKEPTEEPVAGFA